jgi:hypothetical protein
MAGGKSPADLNSESFDINLLKPKARPSKSTTYSYIKNISYIYKYILLSKRK